MRRSLTPAVPPSMYRHFAVVTVLLTAALAMFAEGEDREARAAPAAQVAVRPAAPRIVAANQAVPPAPDWWEVDSSLADETGTVSGDGGAEAGFEDIDEPGENPEYPASLSQDERELLLGGMQESGAASNRNSGSAVSGD